MLVLDEPCFCMFARHFMHLVFSSSFLLCFVLQSGCLFSPPCTQYGPFVKFSAHVRKFVTFSQTVMILSQFFRFNADELRISVAYLTVLYGTIVHAVTRKPSVLSGPLVLPVPTFQRYPFVSLFHKCFVECHCRNKLFGTVRSAL